MILGVKTDPHFGPAVVCGFGGVLVEVLARRVGPRAAARSRDRRRCSTSCAATRVGGVRGQPAADLGALADTIVRVAALAEAGAGDSLRALDLNPLLVLDDGHGVVAVELAGRARVKLRRR